MSNEQAQDPALAAAELENLKARADLLGVKYHPSLKSAEQLREKIAAHQEAEAAKDQATPTSAGPGPGSPAVESEGQKRKRLKNEALKLVRIRLTCMNPAKKDWDGEIITVGNTLVGTVSKYVPFAAEEGWHVPFFLYQVLKDRQCQVFQTIKTSRGVAIRKGKLIKEFAIELLDPLTPEELHDLAQRQAMAKSVD